jgi:ABC-type uncharacterized transport system ATPase subunit
MLIDKGQILFDGGLNAFRKKFQKEFVATSRFRSPPEWIDDPRFSLLERQESQWRIRVSKDMTVKEALALLVSLYEPENFSIHEQNIKDMIAQIFA